jgi:hypothetical protein
MSFMKMIYRVVLALLNRNIDLKGMPYYDERAKKGREFYTSGDTPSR